ncbi:uncharacterized protein METZ01_LOCUS153786 [marine metagenome]|uniref:Uncharacterized protein n=1 Tax=marine metagenome TaxID=408172 RepID=A0A382AIH5_9ZZZZ
MATLHPLLEISDTGRRQCGSLPGQC